MLNRSSVILAEIFADWLECSTQNLANLCCGLIILICIDGEFHMVRRNQNQPKILPSILMESRTDMAEV